MKRAQQTYFTSLNFKDLVKLVTDDSLRSAEIILWLSPSSQKCTTGKRENHIATNNWKTRSSNL